MSRVLITRPWEDAEPLARRLAAQGHEILIEPMLEIVPRDGPPPDLNGVQALLFTSANGVRAFARIHGGRDLPVFAVGDATAGTAREVGFATVASAGGDVQALAVLVADRCAASDGPLLHVAASARAGDLSGALERRGFAVRRAVLYDARPATGLTEAATGALVGGRVDAVLLFSPRTARALVDLLTGAGLRDVCRPVVAACLSEAVAAAADGGEVRWRALRVAARPDQDALIALLGA